MEFVSAVDFEATRLLNKSEYRVLLVLEAVVKELDSGLRVMAQPNMGEFIRPVRSSASGEACDIAFRSINSKRVDFAVIDRFGIPILAIEYQGHGHYHRRSFMRDAVKREVLRKAKVHLIEVPSNYVSTELTDRIRNTLILHCKN